MKRSFCSLRAVSMLSLLIALIVSSCTKESGSSQIPTVPVSFAINPNSTEYIELNHVTGWVYLTGGYKGILVYRSAIDQFMAFERACPYDFQLNDARIVVDDSGLTCNCPVCGSKYIIVDGTPYEGPSRNPLKQYQASYDAASGMLYIYN